METNKQRKKVMLLFIGLWILFMGSVYFIYQSFLSYYTTRINMLQVYDYFTILEDDYVFDISLTVGFVIVVFTVFLIFVYLYVSSLMKHRRKQILHIIDEINNDDFVPSILPGEYGLLEEKIYDIKKKNDFYIESMEKEKQLMSDYIENIAHQIKTPMTSIKLNEDILKMKYDDELLNRNDISFERLEYLLDNLLKLTRLEHGTIHFDLQYKDIRSLFESLYLDVEDMLNGIKMDIDIIDCSFFYDEQWLKEALYNIIKNSIEENVSHILLYNEVHKSSVTIIIKDNGKGIDEKALNHIFERFYRSDAKKKKGCGIGLSLTKEIIEKHHGYIHVYNDEGAVFEIHIPVLDIKEKVIK